MKSCPIPMCGRKFDNDQTMLEHVRRRHPDQYSTIQGQLTESLIAAEHAQQQQLNKLPKLAKIISSQKEGEKKKLYTGIVHHRSQSKGKEKYVSNTNVSQIIHDSRKQILNDDKSHKIGSVKLRPSLNKKVSAPNLIDEKLPSLDSQKIKKHKIQLNKTISKQSHGKQVQTDTREKFQQQNFYTTAPNFNKEIKKDIEQSKKRLLMRSKSKGSKEKLAKQSEHESTKLAIKKASIIKDTHSPTITLNTSEEHKGRNVYRPTRKNIKKAESGEALQIDQKEQDQNHLPITQKLYSLSCKNLSRFDCPKLSTIQYLNLNDCGLETVQLNSLGSLVEISLIKNRLKSMQFLQYPGNVNIRKVFVDKNQIQTQFYLPPKCKIITACFNKISADVLPHVLNCIQNNSELQEIDFSFNSIRKAPNYKVKILEASSIHRSRKLKNIDGLKVTKIDWQIMQEYIRMVNESDGLIPLGVSRYIQSSESDVKDRPCTAASTNFGRQSQFGSNSKQTIDELLNECSQLQKLIKDTSKQLQIIQTENQVLKGELEKYQEETPDKSAASSLELYRKLQRQCECLEALSFLQYADEQELVEMIKSKKNI